MTRHHQTEALLIEFGHSLQRVRAMNTDDTTRDTDGEAFAL
jgi:hypothetical protein